MVKSLGLSCVESVFTPRGLGEILTAMLENPDPVISDILRHVGRDGEDVLDLGDQRP
jgi:hypothetical protein